MQISKQSKILSRQSPCVRCPPSAVCTRKIARCTLPTLATIEYIRRTPCSHTTSTISNLSTNIVLDLLFLFFSPPPLPLHHPPIVDQPTDRSFPRGRFVADLLPGSSLMQGGSSPDVTARVDLARAMRSSSTSVHPGGFGRRGWRRRPPVDPGNIPREICTVDSGGYPFYSL